MAAVSTSSALCNVRYGTRYDFSVKKNVLRYFPDPQRYKLVEIDIESWDGKSVLPHSFTNLRPFVKESIASDTVHKAIPSVTLINGCVSPKKLLYLWQKKQILTFGHAEFRRRNFERMSTSRKLHSYIERLMDQIKLKGSVMTDGRQICDENPKLIGQLQSVMPFFRALGEVNETQRAFVCSERAVANSQIFYKGRFDAVLPIKGNLSLVDWKSVSVSSAKSDPSSSESASTIGMDQYKAQLAAYVHALNIKSAGIVQIFESGREAELTLMTEEEIEHYHQIFLGSVNAYWWTLANRAATSVSGEECYFDFIYTD